jgi:hypothetical protein
MVAQASNMPVIDSLLSQSNLNVLQANASTLSLSALLPQMDGSTPSANVHNSLQEISKDQSVTTEYDMDGYTRSSWDLPDELYRVHYPESRTTFSIQQGFEASDTAKTFGADELNDFKRAIEKHFTWSCRDPLPFISLFSDRKHAENWGRMEPWHGSESSEGSWALYY